MRAQIKKLNRTTRSNGLCWSLVLQPPELVLNGMGVVPSSAAILLSMKPCARMMSSRSTVKGVQGNFDINARPKKPLSRSDALPY